MWVKHWLHCPACFRWLRCWTWAGGLAQQRTRFGLVRTAQVGHDKGRVRVVVFLAALKTSIMVGLRIEDDGRHDVMRTMGCWANELVVVGSEWVIGLLCLVIVRSALRASGGVRIPKALHKAGVPSRRLFSTSRQSPSAFLAPCSGCCI